jgi:hypothetical protein
MNTHIIPNWRSIRHIQLVCFFVLLCVPVTQFVSAGNRQTEKGFTCLFDGESLDGWHLMNGANFIVEDGVIKHRGGLGWLRSEHKYTNFVFRIEFRFMKPRQDGGIFVRSSIEGDKWPKHRYEVQVENSERMARLFGTVYQLDIELAQNALKPIGHWNEYEIRLVGSNIEVFLNGELVCVSGKLDRIEAGYIGLQGENGDHEYRNIGIKDLGDSLN